MKKEKELYSLLGLHDNYVRAGGLVDQSQRRVLLQKMNTLHCELEDETLQTNHLKAKIGRISNDLGTDEGSAAGGLDFDGSAAGKAVDTAEMLYLDQAQALDMSRREEENARALQEINGRSKGRGSKHGSKHGAKKTEKAINAAKSKGPAPRAPLPAEAAAALSALSLTANEVGGASSFTNGEEDEEAMYINSAETRADYAAAETEWLPPPPQLFEGCPATNASLDAGTPPPPPPGDEGADAENPYADFPMPGEDETMPPPPDASDSFYQNVAEVLSSARETGMRAGAGVSIMSSMEEMSQVHYETAVTKNPARSESAGFYVNTTEGIYEELCEAEVPLFYRALYDYTAAQVDDLSIQAGDVLYVLVAREDGWCQGLSTNGKCGFFPQSYVERIEDQESVAAEKPRIVRLTSTPADTLKVEMHPGCPPTVVEVAPGSIPESVGIRVGDCLLEVDEEPCASSSFGTVSSWLSQCESGRTLKICLVSVARIANESSSA